MASVVWKGWEWTEAKRQEYAQRQDEFQTAAHRQMAAFRIFTSDIGTRPRILERLEAAIMTALDQAPAPYCNIPDQGMMLAPRWDTEEPIRVRFTSKAPLLGLPEEMEI